MAKQYPTRDDSTQFPSYVELIDILTNESPRKAVHFDFVQKHDSIFNAYRELSKQAGSDDSWIDAYAELPLDSLVVEIKKNNAELAAYIQENKGNEDIYKNLYTSLIPPEDTTKSDGIFVFGASTNARIERAIELYDDAVASKIIISGNSPHYVENVQSEASRMAAFATKHGGVPEDALILEESSITLPDNVKRTIDMFESMNWHPSSLTIIATNFVLMRAIMEWYKFCPWEIKIKPVAAHPQSAKFTKEGWSKSNDTIALVLNEYAKIITESKIDLMRRDGGIL